MARRWSGGALSLLVLASFTTALPAHAQPLPCEQVWEYVLPGKSGMAVGAPGYFIWVRTSDDRPSFDDGEPSPAQKAAALAALEAGAVSAHCTASPAQARYLFAPGGAEVGDRFSYRWRVVGDTSRLWILDDRGAPGPERLARRVATQAYSGRNRCAALDGAWELLSDGREGMFVHNQGYAAAIYTRADALALRPASSEAERAAAFEESRAFVHRFTCDGSRMDMEILHSSDPREEGRRLSAEFRIEDDIVTWWALDEQGRRGAPDRARRVLPGDLRMEVRALLGALDRAQQAGDLEAFLELSHDDVVYAPPDAPSVVGKEAVAGVYRATFAAFDLRIRHILGETRQEGEQIVTRGRAVGIMTPRDGGEPVSFDNTWVYELRRGMDGLLRFARVTYEPTSTAARSVPPALEAPGGSARERPPFEDA